MRNRFGTVALVLFLSILFSGSVFAQLQTGNLYGTVTDDQAAPLPGATVTLTGPGAPQVQVTDAQGHFRFLALAPGIYVIKAEMEGFSTFDYPNIDVKIGRNTTVDVPMTLEGVITVTGESPLLAERRLSKDTVSAAELEKIPTARDPWEILKTTPGVLVDRINVGGHESGCGSSSRLSEADADEGEDFAGPDTLMTTAMSAAGSLPADLDFEAFREIPTPGDPDIRLRPRRGTNEWRASGSYTESGGDLAGGGHSAETNRTSSSRAGRAELGGSLVVDKLWIWGDAGYHDVQSIALGGQEEEQSGRSGRFKLNAQMGNNVSTLLAASRGDVEGSGIGAAPTRAPETTWEEDGRETVWAVESTAIVSPNFYITASFGNVDGRLDELPRSAGEAARIGPDGVARGSWFGVREERRTRQARLDASLFQGGSTYHEITFGGGWRREEEDSILAPPDPLGISGSLLSLANDFALAESWRGGRADARIETSGLWLQDKMDADDWTLSAGLRADGQDLGIAGGPRPWTFSPRLQLLRTLREEQDMQLRVSVARFASRLDARVPWHLDPGAPAVLRALFTDRDGDLFPDPGEPIQILHGEGLDPLRPDLDPDAVDPRLRPEISDEAGLGFHHVMRSDFLVSLHATWRRTRDLLEERLLVRDAATGAVFTATAGDWVPAGRLTGVLPDGTPYDAPFWDLRPGLTWTGGTLLTNGDRQREDFGLTATWNKRLADGWMTKGSVAWHDDHQRLGPDFRRFDDPTNTLGGGDDAGRPVASIG
ncbi:MAG TPA: TonB-dependent receptor, partial [Thermoanaerobaculia bacterium]